MFISERLVPWQRAEQTLAEPRLLLIATVTLGTDADRALLRGIVGVRALNAAAAKAATL